MSKSGRKRLRYFQSIRKLKVIWFCIHNLSRGFLMGLIFKWNYYLKYGADYARQTSVDPNIILCYTNHHYS